MNKISDDDLKLLENEVIYEFIRRIEEQVSSDGFSCQMKYNREIPNLKSKILPYFIEIEFKDGIPISKIPSKDQKEWVELLNFKFVFSEHYEYKFVKWIEETNALYEVDVCVYFRHTNLLPENMKYKIITKYGDLKEIMIRDRQILVDGEIISSVENWDNLNVFVIDINSSYNMILWDL